MKQTIFGCGLKRKNYIVEIVVVETALESRFTITNICQQDASVRWSADATKNLSRYIKWVKEILFQHDVGFIVGQ